MTLVLGAASRKHIVLVSDRRLTDARDGRTVDDHRNKVTVYDNRFAFAYSGLAQLEGRPTDVWLAKELALAPHFGGALRRIEQRATSAFARCTLGPRLRRHAFAALGWARMQNGRPIPIWITISNALDENGGWLAVARSEFRTDLSVLDPKRPWSICPPIGANLTNQELRETIRRVRPCFRRRSRGPAAALQLGASIRSVARHDSTVGERLLAVVLPPPPENAKELCLIFPPRKAMGGPGDAMSFDLNATDDPQTWILPNVACPGAFMVDCEAVFDGNRFVSARCRGPAPKEGVAMGLGVRGGPNDAFMMMDHTGTPRIIERDRSTDPN